MVEPQVTPEAEKTDIEPTPTPVVDITSLQAKLKAKETELEQTKKGLSTAHQTLTQKDRELKSQADLRAEIRGIREDMELLAVALATGEVEPTDGTNRQNVLAEIKRRGAASEAKLKADTETLAFQERVSTLSGYQKRVEALGLTEEDDDYGDIYRLVRTLDPVDLKAAERRLQKLEAKKVNKAEPKEPEEERITRLVKEQLARDYPNMYASDTGLPSGGKPLSTTEAALKHSKGEITYEEAQKYGVKYD